MGYRTIIAMNHDYAAEIRGNPAELLTLVSALLSGGYCGDLDSPENRDLQTRLSRFGITLTPTHHSTEVSTVSLRVDRSSPPYHEKEL